MMQGITHLTLCWFSFTNESSHLLILQNVLLLSCLVHNYWHWSSLVWRGVSSRKQYSNELWTISTSFGQTHVVWYESIQWHLLTHNSGINSELWYKNYDVFLVKNSDFFLFLPRNENKSSLKILFILIASLHLTILPFFPLKCEI